MAFIAGLLCVVALMWILIRTQRPATGSRPGIGEEAFDGEDARDLFETTPIGYMEIDRKGIIRRVNRVECKLRGREDSSIVGMHCAELIPELERERYREQ